MYLFEVWVFPWVIYKLFKQLKCFVGIWSRSSGSTLNLFLVAVTDTWEKWITRRKEGFLLWFGIFVSWFVFPSNFQGFQPMVGCFSVSGPWSGRKLMVEGHGRQWEWPGSKERAGSCSFNVPLFHTIKSPDDQMVPLPSGWVLTLHLLLWKGPHRHTQNSALH